MDITTIGKQIAALRKERGIKQEELAGAVGVSPQAVSKWESGKSDPSTSNLLMLAKLFKISPEELLREVEQ